MGNYVVKKKLFDFSFWKFHSTSCNCTTWRIHIVLWHISYM